MLREMWGFDSGVDENSSILGIDAVYVNVYLRR
jgi:hypothetical protein